MTATWEIETQFLPYYFNESKGAFFEQILSNGSDFLCDIFNSSFEFHYEQGNLREPITYNANEFYLTAKRYNDIDRLLYIELPEPRKSDFTYNMYVKCYCIPYRVKKDGIQIFDMYGIDAVRDIDVGFIIWYKNAQHMMSNLKLPVSVDNRNELVDFMGKYIFKRL